MLTRLFRHRADIPAALFVLTVFGLQLAVFFLVDNPWHAAGWVAVLLLAQVSCGAICHNHHHVNIFTVRPLNRALEVVMYLQTGTSPLSWTIHHNIGHHREYLDPERDPSKWKHSDGRPMARLYYDFVNAALIYPEIWRIGRRHPELFARFKRLFVLSNLVLLGFFLLDPVMTLIVFVAPMLILLVLLLDNTFLQHSGLELDNHFVASRSVENRLYNLTSWNLGFHAAHHMHPGVHWTELPDLHARIRPQIPPHLITTSVLGLPSAAERALRARTAGDSSPVGDAETTG
ncbi:MAG: fatty acid desaturase family protein [Pseudomonadota bacterium]